MGSLILIGAVTGLTVGIVAATIVMLTWRSPFLSVSRKWLATIATVLAALLLTALITWGYNKFILNPYRPVAVKNKKEPVGDFLYGYKVLLSGRQGSLEKVALLVGKRATKEEIELALDAASRDQRKKGLALDILVFNDSKPPFTSAQSSFVCQLKVDKSGTMQWNWNPYARLSGEKPIL